MKATTNRWPPSAKIEDQDARKGDAKMKRKKMRILATLAGSALAVALLPYLVNVDQLRPRLESSLQSHLGREVHIGYLELSLLAGGARAGNLSIADDPAFGSRPFLHAKSLEVGVSWLSLIFSHTLHLTSLKIEEPELYLVKSSSGKWNFSTLGAGSAPDITSADLGAPDSALSAFALDRLTIRNATIVLPGSPGSSQSRALNHVDIDLRNASFGGTMSFVASTHSEAGRIELRGEAGPVDHDHPERTPFHATINGANANLAQIASLKSSSGPGGILGWNGSLNSDGRSVHGEGTAHAERLRLAGSGPGSRQPISLRYVTDYSLAQRSGELEQCEISVRQSRANLAGTYQVRGDTLVAQLRLAASQLALDDVEGVLPALGIELPGGSKLHGGTVSATLALTGPVDRLVTAGTVQLANANLAGFDLGSKLSALPGLSAIPSAQNLAIVSLSSGFRIGPQGTHISNFNSQIAGIGGLSGSGDVDAASHLKFNMEAHLAGGFAGLKKVPNEIPFEVIGTTSVPIFVPDLSGMTRNPWKNPKKPFFPFFSNGKDPAPVPSKERDKDKEKEREASPAPAARKPGFVHKLFHWGKQKNQNERNERNQGNELAAKR
jgi:AsmA protein